MRLSKKMGPYRSFKRKTEKKEKNENVEYASSKGLEKVKKKDQPRKSGFMNELRK
jgi:hypothetical protein